ncbi:MAG TPA: sigma 54-interacting transcriptional regulator [Terriglobales bacterium]|nr:sigma 54-interacting transcriptional regulator [Terriglobales bacterium]
MDASKQKPPPDRSASADLSSSAGNSLRECQERFQQLADNLQEIFWMIDVATMHAIYVNAAFEQITGRTCASLYESPLSYREIIHAEDRARVLNALHQAKATGKFEEEFRITRADGVLRWVSARGFPIRDSQGNTYRLGGVVQDITERRQVEAALRESEDRYRDLVEHSQDLLCTHDLQGRLLSCNPAPARILGYTVEELLQMNMRELLAPEVRHLFDEYLVKIRQSETADGLLVLQTRAGERRIWEYHNTLRTDGASPIVRGMAQDVTERRRAEAALRKSEERFRVALENSRITVFHQDEKLRYTWIYHPTLAWAEHGYLGKTDEEIVGEAAASQLTAIKRQVLETGVGTHTGVEIIINDKKYLFDLTIEPQLDGNGRVTGITCACMDITEFLEKAERLQLLLEVNSALVSKLELKDLFPTISSCIGRLIEYDFASVSVCDRAQDVMRGYPLDVNSARRLMNLDVAVPMEESLAATALRDRDVKLFCRGDIESVGSGFVARLLGEDIQSFCCIPIHTSDGPVCTLNLGSKKSNAFDAADIYLMRQLGAQLGIALDNAQVYGALGQLNEKLRQEKLYLESEIRKEFHFDEMIGSSPTIKEALRRAEMAAFSDSAVLICGAPGTGKELIARAIHGMGKRNARSFVKLNCAALPVSLLASELFGHEKEAFPGAVGQKRGVFELADGGTLFLDQVAELPLDLQLQLLRVIKDKEVERLGSSRGIPVNVRLIASTRWDLEERVREGKFRQELYYRLNVLPIHTTPLRERREDIPVLVAYFVRKHAERMNKEIEVIPPSALDALTNWSWPGNVRELENFVERSVILTKGTVLEAPIAELRAGRDRLQ